MQTASNKKDEHSNNIHSVDRGVLDGDGFLWTQSLSLHQELVAKFGRTHSKPKKDLFL